MSSIYRYFHTSDSEAVAKLAKMNAQAKRLADKREKLATVEAEALPASKAEYDAVLADARTDYFKQVFGKAVLGKLREEARKEYGATVKERARLEREVASGEKAAGEALLSKEEFVAELVRARTVVARGCGAGGALETRRRIGDRPEGTCEAVKQPVGGAQLGSAVGGLQMESQTLCVFPKEQL